MPFRAFHENLVEFGEDQISYHFSSCIRIGVHEVERFRNALKLLWHKANGVKDHILDLVLDLGNVSHAQGEFRAILLHASFNSRKPQFKP